MSLEYDNEIGIGYGFLKLSPDHPFFAAALRHDWAYDDLINGTSPKTLKQIDQEFHNNMIRTAWRLSWLTNDPTKFVRYAIMAHRFYKIARWWAVHMRPELEAYRPGGI